MEFFAVLLLAALTHCTTVDVPTYKYQDPVSGEIHACTMCPPGTRMAAHCSATTATECVPCQEVHFTQYWNYLLKCLYCNAFCGNNQEVEQECSPFSNRVCRCKEGYYLVSDETCRRHSVCGPGTRVKTRGTSRDDTVCEECPHGYFSNSALESCVKHRECNASGHVAFLRGSRFHDTVCASCEDIRNGGSSEELQRLLLPELFAKHQTRVGKIKKFVSRNIQKTGAFLPRNREYLLGQISMWSAQAPVDQLRRVPEMLRSSQLHSLAKRLKSRLQEIQQQAPPCS